MDCSLVLFIYLLFIYMLSLLIFILGMNFWMIKNSRLLDLDKIILDTAKEIMLIYKIEKKLNSSQIFLNHLKIKEEKVL